MRPPAERHGAIHHNLGIDHFVASELKDPIWHSLEWQIGSFSSEATICWLTQVVGFINVIILSLNSPKIFIHVKPRIGVTIIDM